MQLYAVTVDVLVVGAVGADQVDTLMDSLDADNGALSATEPDVVPGRLGVTVDVQATTARAAAGKGHDRILELIAAAGPTVTSVEHLEVLTEDAQLRAHVVIPDLVGSAEIEKLVNLSRQRIHQLSSLGRLPEPVAVLARGAVYVKSEVLEAARSWNRTPSLHQPPPPPPPPPPRRTRPRKVAGTT